MLFVCSLMSPSHCRDADDLLVLTHPEVTLAFQDFLLPTDADRTRAHLVLAGDVNPDSLPPHTR